MLCNKLFSALSPADIFKMVMISKFNGKAWKDGDKIFDQSV